MARIIASFSIVPLGTCDTSLSKYVALAIKELDKHNVKYQLTPMNTIIEGDCLDEIFNAIKIAHSAVEKAGAKRISIRINIDDRLDRPDRRAMDKVRAVEEKIKE